MKKSEVSLPVVDPHAAGIDIGSKSHWVAVDQLHEHVREFGVYTKIIIYLLIIYMSITSLP